MGYFRIIWFVWKNWKYRPFRMRLRKLMREWEREPSGEIAGEPEVSTKLVIPPPEVRRKFGTELFYFSAPEKGEKRNLERTGTYTLTEDELSAELERRGRNPDGSLRQPK